MHNTHPTHSTLAGCRTSPNLQFVSHFTCASKIQPFHRLSYLDVSQSYPPIAISKVGLSVCSIRSIVTSMFDHLLSHAQCQSNGCQCLSHSHPSPSSSWVASTKPPPPQWALFVFQPSLLRESLSRPLFKRRTLDTHEDEEFKRWFSWKSKPYIYMFVNRRFFFLPKFLISPGLAQCTGQSSSSLSLQFRGLSPSGMR